MLVLRVTEVVYVKLIMPIRHHGLMVVGPTIAIGLRWMFAIGTQNLDIMHSNDRRETTVVPIGIAECLACVMYFSCIQQPVENSFISLEDSAVNVTFRAWTRTQDYFNLRWKYTAEIKKRFDEEKITIPFPQRVVHFVDCPQGPV